MKELKTPDTQKELQQNPTRMGRLCVSDHGANANKQTNHKPTRQESIGLKMPSPENETRQKPKKLESFPRGSKRCLEVLSFISTWASKKHFHLRNHNLVHVLSELTLACLIYIT